MIKSVKVAAVLAAVVGSITMVGLSGNSAFASSDNPSLAFDPICTSQSAGVALFRIKNNEETDVTLTYANALDSDTVTLESNKASLTNPAPSDFNYLFVPYDSASADITFSFGTNSVVKTQANAGTECSADQLPVTPTPPAPVCVDGRDASNLNVVWKGGDQIAITTKGGLPLCDDVSVYYSTYRMPDNYDGRGFYPDNSGVANSTAYPQSLIQSYAFTLTKNTYGSWLMNVPAPDYCYNVQADLYYGPEITTVGANGHGTQNIASQIFARDSAQCAPGRGAGSTTTMTTSTPTTLPNTGVADLGNNILGSFLTLAFGGIGLAAAGLRTLRQN